MRNIKLTIQYDGTKYCGWQSQKNKNSIQETIERVLSNILQEKINLIGSGRTDSGVHAKGQVANFKTNSKISSARIKKALNGLLPHDIKIREIEEVRLGFHSRFDSKAKTYRYLIFNSSTLNPFLDRFSYFYHYKLNIALMKKAAKMFLGKHDFRAFCASGASCHDTIREIKNISIKIINHDLFEDNNSLISVEIEADGFLYNMVRSIVGTLAEIAREKMSIDSLTSALKNGRRCLIGKTFPAKGLHLINVEY
ncbi:MAG: tRNA pseudouridine(38-40) synthase TruA [Candidatus Omnitrophota bacterium]